MKKLRTLIIDDEEISRKTLRTFIEKYSEGVEIVGEAGSVTDAKNLIDKLQPDLLFLDVEMPYGNAFDLLESISNPSFEVIFVTAYSHYALKALNYSASYYILKPIDIDEMIQGIAKVRERIENKDKINHTEILINNLSQKTEKSKRLVIPCQEGFEVIKTTDIIYCKAEGNYTEFHLQERRRKTASKNLKFFESILDSTTFVRVHKSYIVNLDEIRNYHKGKGGYLIMSEGSEVEVSSNKKEELLRRFY